MTTAGISQILGTVIITLHAPNAHDIPYITNIFKFWFNSKCTFLETLIVIYLTSLCVIWAFFGMSGLV
jgi:hypothetical protein